MSNISKVTIHLDGDTHNLDVNKSESILEAGLENDIDLPYSCQSGVCTACQGRLISGNVEMDVTDGLSDKEIKDGYVLCCQAIPISDIVEIKID
tara:strand:+ start:157 stop:438 length:282 start_codon:yes stop_codon:yes gene_type:complete